ncbi:hypothetical protein ACI2OX_02360 [Bacillus sp. N9]
MNDIIHSYSSIDLLIHEATYARKRENFHSSMEEVIQAYDLDKIKELIFVHLSDQEPYEETLAMYQDDLTKKCTIAADMYSIQL